MPATARAIPVPSSLPTAPRPTGATFPRPRSLRFVRAAAELSLSVAAYLSGEAISLSYDAEDADTAIRTISFAAEVASILPMETGTRSFENDRDWLLQLDLAYPEAALFRTCALVAIEPDAITAKRLFAKSLDQYRALLGLYAL